jgi:hypothetical protein
VKLILPSRSQFKSIWTLTRTPLILHHELAVMQMDIECCSDVNSRRPMKSDLKLILFLMTSTKRFADLVSAI